MFGRVLNTPLHSPNYYSMKTNIMILASIAEAYFPTFLAFSNNFFELEVNYFVMLEKWILMDIKYACKIFRETNISNPLIRTRTCAYQGVKNDSFRKILFTY